MLFTLHQWLELAAIVVIPLALSFIIGRAAGAIEDRRQSKWQKRCDREMAALEEKLKGMPD